VGLFDAYVTAVAQPSCGHGTEHIAGHPVPAVCEAALGRFVPTLQKVLAILELIIQEHQAFAVLPDMTLNGSLARLCVAVGMEAAGQGLGVYFVTAHALVEDLRKRTRRTDWSNGRESTLPRNCC
jgi:hypothetical protein